MELLKRFQGILFGYKIIVFSDNNNLVYAATLSEPQWVMLWRLNIEEIGTNTQHVSIVDNIVAYKLNILPSKSFNKYKPIMSTA